MVRELVFLDADNASDFCELGFVYVQGRGVDGRKLDGEILVGSFGLVFLVLWALLFVMSGNMGLNCLSAGLAHLWNRLLANWV